MIGLSLGLSARARFVETDSGTPPELTNAVDTALGPTSATITVDTDVGDGVLYWVIVPNADSDPTPGEVKAGQRSGGAAAKSSGSQAVSGTGTQTITTKPTMLTPETAYDVVFMHESAAAAQSDILRGDGFTTKAVVIGVINGNATSTADPVVCSGPLTVAVDDLIWVTTSEQSAAVTVAGVTDDLGNTYTAQNAGTVVASVNACRSYYSIVTAAGTITTVNIDTTASSNDFAAQVAGFNGPFTAIDKNIANKNEFARPWTGTTTGTLSQASELVIGWIGTPSSAGTVTSTSPWTAAGAHSTTGLRRTAIQYQNVEATTACIPEFNGDADQQSVTGTASFRRAV